MLRKSSLAVLFAACAVAQGRLQAGAALRSTNADVMNAEAIMERELVRERLLQVSLSYGYDDEDKPGEPLVPPTPGPPTPGEPAPTPEEPAPTPGEPAPTPAEPAPTPEDPEDPAPTPEEPAPTPEEPAPTPEEPAPTPEEPAPTPEEPAPTPDEPAPAPTPVTPPAPGGLTLSSTAFAPGGAIPVEFTCDGTNISPPMSWSPVPDGTVTWALTVEDTTTPWDHWVLFNVGAPATNLPQNVPPQPGFSDGSIQGTNSFGNFGYGGMCPSDGDFTQHSYIFRLYALNTSLTGLSSATTRAELEQAIADQNAEIERSEMGATYQREEE